jgi:hypothetical protein
VPDDGDVGSTGDDGSSDDGGGALIVSENDADQSFGLSDVGTNVQDCSSGASSSQISPDKKHWVEIALVDQENHPVAGVAYRITVPGGTVVEGGTDAKGRGRVDGIDAGTCRITFPVLDKDVWKKK